MADRYWVGGTGTWNTTSTTNWSASSGGAGGASVPTTVDNVFFDQAATYTVTMTGALSCQDITVSAGVVTFATGTTPTLQVKGSMSLLAGTVWNTTGQITFTSTSTGRTITTNGTTLSGSLIFNGVNGGWTLGSALTTSSTILVTTGIFDTSSVGNYALTCTVFSTAGSATRTINFNASTITISIASATAFNGGLATGLTFNAGTSQINFTSSTSGISSPNLTFNNVAFTSAAASGITITGANTFNTLSFAGRTSVGISPVTFSANQTISTLTLTAGTAAAYRTFLRSDTIGTQRTLSVGTLTAGAADYDFQDIAITGAAAPIAPTRAGDCKGNSGITFPAAKTVYYRNSVSSSWGTTGSGVWSLTNGGAFDATAFPLAQDTAVFPSSPTPYPGSGVSISIAANYNIGTIDMSARTANTMTLGTGTTAILVFGNWINGTGITISGTGSLSFQGRGAQTITSAGRSFTQNVGTISHGGTVTLQDAFVTTSTTQSGMSAGTVDANGYNYTAIGFSSNNTGVRTISIGSGTWTLNGSIGNTWNTPTITNLTVTGTGTISLTSGTAKSFAGGGIQTYPTLNQGGIGALTVSGDNRFAAITATTAATILLTSGSINQTSNINTTGTAALTVVPTTTTASLRGTVHSGNTTFTGPLSLGVA